MLGLPKVVLGVAALLSVLTSGLVYNYIKEPAHGAMEKVVIAAKEIPARTAITPDMLKIAELPANIVQQGSAKQVDALIGAMSKGIISSGDQITERKIVVPGQAANDLVLAIPNDKRAFTVGVDGGTDGAVVKAGDHVDLAVTFNGNGATDTVSSIVLQNILVLAAGKDGSQNEADRRTPVTLAVSPEDASALALAADKGTVHLVLRPLKANPHTALVQPVTTEDLVGAVLVKPAYFNENSLKSAVYSIPEPAVTAPASSAPASGITVIRGTKQEIVNVN